jgi:hypothetical protein
MDNDLNNFFVTIEVYEGDKKLYSYTLLKSLLHSIRKCKYPGSPYDVRVIDNTENYRINSKIIKL